MLATVKEWSSLELAIIVCPNIVACGSCIKVGMFVGMSATCNCNVSRLFDMPLAMEGRAIEIVTIGEKNPIAPILRCDLR